MTKKPKLGESQRAERSLADRDGKPQENLGELLRGFRESGCLELRIQTGALGPEHETSVSSTSSNKLLTLKTRSHKSLDPTA